MKGNLLSSSQLAALLDSGAVTSCALRPAGDDWWIAIATKTGEYVLAKQRVSEVRAFKTLDAACAFLQQAGLGKVTVELAKWQRGQQQLAVSKGA